MVVHAGDVTAGYMLEEGVGGHGEDGDIFCVGQAAGPDGLGSGVTIWMSMKVMS